LFQEQQCRIPAWESSLPTGSEQLQTFEYIRLALFYSLQGSVHEQPREFSSINALLPPLVHPISYAHAYHPMPVWMQGPGWCMVSSVMI